MESLLKKMLGLLNCVLHTVEIMYHLLLMLPSMNKPMVSIDIARLDNFFP